MERDNPVLAAAQEHLKTLETKEIVVPEWPVDGEPTVIYARPCTLEERRKCIQLNKDDPLGQFVELIIMKAMNADGAKIFKRIHKRDLMAKTDEVVLTRIADEITGENYQDPNTGDTLSPGEHAAKNLRAIPSSK